MQDVERVGLVPPRIAHAVVYVIVDRHHSTSHDRGSLPAPRLVCGASAIRR
jgi:hypothetical protein